MLFRSCSWTISQRICSKTHSYMLLKLLNHYLVNKLIMCKWLQVSFYALQGFLFIHLAPTTYFTTFPPSGVHTKRPKYVSKKKEIDPSLNGTSHKNSGNMNMMFMFIVKGCHMM